MVLIVLIYIVLLIIFFTLSGIIVRHTIKYGYLAPTFKFLVGVFLVFSVLLIGASAYFLFTARDSSNLSTPNYQDDTPVPSTSNSNSFNF